MDGRFNTIAGWVLGAGIVLLGASLVTGEIFKAERPETMGYPIAGVVEEGEGGARPSSRSRIILQTADAARGEAVFRKCAACHTINQGGANGLGPNLFGDDGRADRPARRLRLLRRARGHGGNWDWETMSPGCAARAPSRRAPDDLRRPLRPAGPRRRDALSSTSMAARSPMPPPPAAAPAEGNAAAPATRRRTKPPATQPSRRPAAQADQGPAAAEPPTSRPGATSTRRRHGAAASSQCRRSSVAAGIMAADIVPGLLGASRKR